jgi:carbonic anhydrase
MENKSWIRGLVVIAVLGVSACIGFSYIQEKQISSDEALSLLMEGNSRYVKGELLHPNRGFSRRQETESGQMPFAIVLGCADSRVAPEILFDAGIGEIFTVRVAGNVAGDIELHSIEFAATHFHSPCLLVLGHKNCGAVKAVLAGDVADIQPIAALIQPALIQPALEDTKKESKELSLEEAVKLNVLAQVALLQENPVLKERMQKNKLKILGGYYDLESGAVEILK